jgi:hypothetical protein
MVPRTLLPPLPAGERRITLTAERLFSDQERGWGRRARVAAPDTPERVGRGCKAGNALVRSSVTVALARA